MKKYLYNGIIFLFIVGVFLVSCSESEPEEIITTELSGTRWANNNWDYSIGDDYITITEDGIEYIFYSASQGAMYEWSKEYDSDYGNGHSRKLSFFNYECTGSNVVLNFIVPTSLSTKKMIFENGQLRETNGISYSIKKFDSNTRGWLSNQHGTTGECNWYYDLKSTLVITGDGKMADYASWEATPWSKLTKYHAINKVEFTGGVKNIGNYAFSSPSIGEAYLSSKIESIGIGAFSGSTLGSIWIPSSVKEIKADAFSGCKYLKNINCMYNVEIIGDCAFCDCSNISLVLCNKIRSIGKMAFLECRVTSFTPSEQLVTIESGAFSNCDFSTLKLPNSLKYLGHNAFSSNKINKIEIGTDLETVSGTPFYVTSSGKLYVNKNTPINLSDDLIETAKNWTLIVPSGSKNVYSKTSYWKNFKSINEDTSLKGDGTTPSEIPDEPEEDSSKYNGSLNGHDWVDLGLSVKWATLNVGASTQTNAGDYYNWGHNTTNWETDVSDLAGKEWSGKINDDPITKLWGNGWKTPTKDNFEELINNCTFSHINENGIKCIKVTSKKNSQYIIIPLSGRMDGFRDYGETLDELNYYGKIAYLWTASSETNSNTGRAYYFVAESSSTIKPQISSRSLCINIYTYYFRMPMRGVCK